MLQILCLRWWWYQGLVRCADFPMNKLHRLPGSRFRSDRFSKLLQDIFQESDGSTALLGSEKLKTLLLIVMRTAGADYARTTVNGDHFL